MKEGKNGEWIKKKPTAKSWVTAWGKNLWNL
jgi:hypothetical protein